jgi:23S rRNA pseudouridine2605 synthase
MERIAKLIARAGVCSRRQAEILIAERRVQIDGKIIDSPAIKVNEQNIVKVDGREIITHSTRLWIYHKPKGLITSHKDEKDRPTVFDKLPKYLPRVISVGRLDYNTEGLLLLTNDGELSRFLELPTAGLVRMYRVRVYGKIDMRHLQELQKGIVIDNISYKPVKIELEHQKGDNSWLIVSITEGKNREIRKIFEYFNLQVNRLIRISYGPFELGNLPVGEVYELTDKDILKIGYK